MTYVSEKYQLGIVAEYLRENNIRFITEAEMYDIPIDILALNDDDVIAIELKSKDVGRGLSQAERNTSYADFSYLSLWQDNISTNTIERFDRSPIGLFSVNEYVECLSFPERNQPNDYANSKAKEMIKNDV